MPGYIHISTANFNPDGTLYLGASFLPRKYLSYTKDKYDAMAFYSSLTFLPFLEVNFRATRILNLPHEVNYTVDRMPSIRINLLKEQKYLPSVVIGIHDFISTTDNGTARNFGASYLVATKGFNYPTLFLNSEITAGYGTNWLNSSHNEFIGLWGGISLKCNKLKFISLIIEYDGKTTNAGLQCIFFKHLHLTTGMLNFDSFTGCINYHIRILSGTNIKKHPKITD